MDLRREETMDLDSVGERACKYDRKNQDWW